jgi:hypothetical protein
MLQKDVNLYFVWIIVSDNVLTLPEMLGTKQLMVRSSICCSAYSSRILPLHVVEILIP